MLLLNQGKRNGKPLKNERKINMMTNTRFTTVEEIADDMILTFAQWTDESVRSAISNISLYINDWYGDCNLSKEEFEEIESIVSDFFSEEE